MSYHLVIQAEAILDIQEAFEWYEKQKMGLGYELIKEIEICYEKLSESPEYYTYLNERYRRIKTHRFPYILVYEIEENNVIINSIHHAKRESKY
jgi:plasmid stabilization system protein ParE